MSDAYNLKCRVATVLTVYGIETSRFCSFVSCIDRVATVLTVYGIETNISAIGYRINAIVATVLTVYGIETSPFTYFKILNFLLQQYLPFTVLKLLLALFNNSHHSCCNSTYRLRY